MSTVLTIVLALLVYSAIGCNPSTATHPLSTRQSAEDKSLSERPERLTNVVLLSHSRWIVADWKSVWITENAGSTWRRTLGPSKQDGHGQFTGGLSFLNEHIGFAVLDNTVFRTKDRGKTWEKTSDDHLDTFNVFFKDSMNGWAVGFEWRSDGDDPAKPFMAGMLWRTQDGGARWEKQNLPTLHMDSTERWYLSDVFFSDSMNGWAVGLGEFLHSADGGESWTELRIHDRLTRIAFADALVGWTVWKESGEFRLTTDGGKTWKLNDKVIQNTDGQILFVNRKSGFAIQNLSKLIKTEDGGENWEAVLIENNPLEQLNTSGELHAYIGRAKDQSLVAFWLTSARVVSVVSTDNGSTWQKQ